MSDAPAPWDEVRARVTRSRPEQDALRSALAVGWRVATNGDGRWRTVREELGRHPDSDEDDVAAVYFALGAAGGSAEDAGWAAQRCIDAAVDRITCAEDATAYRTSTWTGKTRASRKSCAGR